MMANGEKTLEVLVLDKPGGEAWPYMMKKARELGITLVYHEDGINHLSDYPVCLVRSNTHFNKETIEMVPRGGMVVRLGAGTDNVKNGETEGTIYEKEINVVKTPYANGVAELVIQELFNLRSDVWKHDVANTLSWEKKSVKRSEIKGTSLGVIGLGNIGLEVARKALGLGMDVYGYDVVPEAIERAKSMGVETLEDYLDMAEMDAITLHVPGNSETEGMIGEEYFKNVAEGKNQMLVNASRGAVIDYDALDKAIMDEKVGGLALDVYPNENELKKLLNSEKLPSYLENIVDAANSRGIQIILTPHIGASTRQAQLAIVDMALGAFKDYFNNGLTNDNPAGYRIVHQGRYANAR